MADVKSSLALALWTWDAVGLEAGEAAIFTSGSPVDPWLAVVAGWRSVREVIRLDIAAEESAPGPGLRNLRITEPQEAVSRLQAEIRGAPGVAAAIVTPEAIISDVLLEALPMWSRIALGTSASRPATVDFYNNVHRKGTRILSVPASPEDLADARWSSQAAAYLAQAGRILDCERLAAQCPR